jgi:crotonobetainyl-CoA:carnitine CoA-transferase CaiB-like acyl-CoA transferase
MPMNKNYFAGLRVLDHTRYLLGGYATQALADLGAEVIKIEDTGTGDFCRMEEPLRNGVSHYFSALNRNKKSVCLNLKSEEGRQAYFRLVETADVVIENFRPGVTRRLGIDYEAEKSVKPNIIHCGMSSFGQDDPRSLKALHDINFQALSGYLSLNGGKISPIHFVDVSTGMVAIQSILAALLQRSYTGEGAFCDVKMFDSFVWWNALIDARYDFYGGQITPDTLDFPALSYNVYPTKDGGSVSIAMLEEKFWAAFLKALDREDLLPYKRFRRQEAPEAFAAMESIFLSRTTQEWKDFLSDKDICAMPTQTKEEAISYIISSDTGLMRYITFPRTGKTLQTRSPISLSSVPISLDGATPCPLLGEHTVDVLKDLGYSQENIQSMIEAGAVGAYKE